MFSASTPYFNSLILAFECIWQIDDLVSYFDEQRSSGTFEFEFKSNANCPLFEHVEEDLPIGGTLKEYWQFGITFWSKRILSNNKMRAH